MRSSGITNQEGALPDAMRASTIPSYFIQSPRSTVFILNVSASGAEPGNATICAKKLIATGVSTGPSHRTGASIVMAEDSLMTPSDVWSDISHLHQKDPERKGYATQKPAALVERIILASSEEEDLVFDCFCGSGVTPLTAQQLGRRWVACDSSELAIATTRGAACVCCS